MIIKRTVNNIKINIYEKYLFIKVSIYLKLHKNKKISALIRAKNEEDFLYQSVKSIINFVDEVVIVDNNSEDNTPLIIDQLYHEFPLKIKKFNYPFEVTKIGPLSKKLFNKNKKSQSHITNFTNWCIQKCSLPYILKWDADMIATNNIKSIINYYRKKNIQLVRLVGLNIHPDNKHYIKKVSDKKHLERLLYPCSLDNYLGEITSYEYRLFPKCFTKYESDSFPYFENLLSDFEKFPSLTYVNRKIVYLHMKYCKKDPFEIMSKTMRQIILSNLNKGDKLSKEHQNILNNS